MPSGDRLESPRSYPLLPRHDRLHTDLQQDRGSEARRDDHGHLARGHAANRAMEKPASSDPNVWYFIASDELDLLEGHERRNGRRALSRRIWARSSGDAED